MPLVFVAALYLRIAGSAVVVDETKGVTSAVITNSGGSESSLLRLGAAKITPSPRWKAQSRGRCRDGSRRRWEYVTGFADTK